MILRSLTIAGLLLATASAAAAQQPAPGSAEAAAYVIGPEDVLDVAVWGNTDVSRTMPVRPDGKISLPLLNDVQAAGLPEVGLAEDLHPVPLPQRCADPRQRGGEGVTPEGLPGVPRAPREVEGGQCRVPVT